MASNVLANCPECGQRNGKKLEICGKCGHSLIRNGKGHSRPRTIAQRKRFVSRR